MIAKVKSQKHKFLLANSDTKPHYGLRKLGIGMASVLLSTTLFLGANSQTSHAATTDNSNPEIEDNQNGLEQEAQQDVASQNSNSDETPATSQTNLQQTETPMQAQSETALISTQNTNNADTKSQEVQSSTNNTQSTTQVSNETSAYQTQVENTEQYLTTNTLNVKNQQVNNTTKQTMLDTETQPVSTTPTNESEPNIPDDSQVETATNQVTNNADNTSIQNTVTSQTPETTITNTTNESDQNTNNTQLNTSNLNIANPSNFNNNTPTQNNTTTAETKTVDNAVNYNSLHYTPRTISELTNLTTNSKLDDKLQLFENKLALLSNTSPFVNLMNDEDYENDDADNDSNDSYDDDDDQSDNSNDNSDDNSYDDDNDQSDDNDDDSDDGIYDAAKDPNSTVLNKDSVVKQANGQYKDRVPANWVEVTPANPAYKGIDYNKKIGLTKTVKRVITFWHRDDDDKLTQVQGNGVTDTATFTRDAFINPDNPNEMKYLSWNRVGQLEPFRTVDLTPYNTDPLYKPVAIEYNNGKETKTVKIGDKIPEMAVDPTQPNLDIKVIYEKAPATGTVTWVDIDNDNKVLKTVHVYGKGGGEVQYDVEPDKENFIRQGYTVDSTPFDLGPIKFMPGSKNAWEIDVEHDYKILNPDKDGTHPKNPSPNSEGPRIKTLEKKVTRTIHYTGAGDQTPQNHKDAITFKRTARVDMVTGQVEYRDWSQGGIGALPRVDTPNVDGYTPNKDFIGTKNVTPNDTNFTETVNYTKNKPNIKTKTLTRHIIYKSDGHGGFNAPQEVTQTTTLTSTDGGDYTGGHFDNVKTPVIDGWWADQSSVDSLDDPDENGNYDITITYHPNGHVIARDKSKPVPGGYSPIDNAPKLQFKTDPNDASKVLTHLKVADIPGYQPEVQYIDPNSDDPSQDVDVFYDITTNKKTIKRIIHYIDASNNQKLEDDKTETINIIKHGLNDWENGNFKEEAVPVKTGYIADKKTIPAVATKQDTTEVTVYYYKLGKFVPVTPNQQPIKDAPQVQYQNDPDDPTKVLPDEDIPNLENYTPKNGSYTMTPANPRQNTPIVYVANDQTQDVTRTIHYVDENGESLHDDTLQKKTMHKIGTGDWENITYDEVVPPVIKGYVADQNKVAAQKSNKDEEVTVHYTKLGKIIPVDNNGNPIPGIGPKAYENDPDNPTKVKPNEDVPTVPNYTPTDAKVTPQDPTKDTNVVYNPNQEHKTVTRTIKYVNEVNKEELQKSTTQQVQLTKTGNSDWQAGTYNEVIPPVIKGYIATIGKVPSATATNDTTYTVLYKPVGKFVPVDNNGKPIPGTNPEPYQNDPNDPSKVIPNEDVPNIPGYTPNRNKVTPQDPTKDTNITYTKNEDTVSINIKFFDQTDNKEITTKTISGENGSKHNYNPSQDITNYEKQGYDVVSNDYKPNDNFTDAEKGKTYTITLKHHITPVDPRKDPDEKNPKNGQKLTELEKDIPATNIYTYKSINGPQALPDKKYTLKVYAPGEVDMVTGKVTRTGDFTDPDESLLDKSIPPIKNYQGTIESITSSSTTGWTVHIVYIGQTAPNTKIVKQTIHYVVPDGVNKPQDNVQEFTFSQIGKTDPKTGQVTYNDNDPKWINPQKSREIVPPVINGYVADVSIVPSKTYNHDSTSTTITVTYKKVGNFVPVDNNGKPIPGTNPEPYKNDPDDPSKVIPNEDVPNVPGYTPNQSKVTPQDPTKDTTITYTPNDQTKQVSRVINYVGPDNKPLHDPTTQTITITKLGNGDWQPGTYKEIIPPVIKGYVADISKVPSKNSNDNETYTVHYKKVGNFVPVDNNGKPIPGANPQPYQNDPDNPSKVLPNEDVPNVPGYTPNQSKVTPQDPTKDTTVTYTPNNNEHQVQITFVDNVTGKPIKTKTLTGKTGDDTHYNTKADISDLETKGYYVIQDDTNGQDLKINDKTNYTVKLGHKTQNVIRQKTIKRIIQYQGPDGLKVPGTATQSITFVDNGKKDLVTGKTTWDSDTKSLTKTFNEVPSPHINGYIANPASIKKINVTINSQNWDDLRDLIYTVTYKADPNAKKPDNNKPVNPNNNNTENNNNDTGNNNNNHNNNHKYPKLKPSVDNGNSTNGNGNHTGSKNNNGQNGNGNSADNNNNANGNGNATNNGNTNNAANNNNTNGLTQLANHVPNDTNNHIANDSDNDNNSDNTNASNAYKTKALPQTGEANTEVEAGLGLLMSSLSMLTLIGAKKRKKRE